MRKIYSLVLLAAALLVGTNVWAEGEIQVATKDALRTNWYSAPSGSVIQLTDNIYDMDTILWLGTATATETPRSLTLDLNGYILKGTKRHMFLLTHGELIIRNSGTDGKIWHAPAPSEMKSGENSRYSGDAFVLCGSARQDVNAKVSGYFTHLVIEEGVVIDANDGVNAISLDVLENYVAGLTTGSYKHVSDSRFGSRPSVIEYHTNLFTAQASYGVANGVLVDIKGTIMAYKYGIKTNGCVREQTYNSTIATSRYNNTEFDSFNKDINNTYSPYIHLHSTGRIKVTDTGLSGTGGSQALAVYASGYARWLLEGYCGGNVGVYAKSGDIDIVNATIESTNPNSANTTGRTSGSSTQGCAIVIESTEVQSGQIVVDIEGSEVSAQSGYAIEETVTKPAEEGSYTSNVTIEDSNINGGNEGAIAVSTKSGETYVVTVETGSVQGEIKDETNPSTPVKLTDLIKDTENTHTTTVYDENGQNPVVVVSPGAATPASEKDCATIADAAGKTTVNLTGAGFAAGNVISSDLTLTELEMNLTNGSNQPQWQRVVINNNAVVKIGKVILGAKANIIVEAGSKLIITGADGIYSRVDTNLVLRANATEQATFVIGPNVTSNRQPQATVEYTLKAGMPTSSSYLWQRFSTPICVTNKPTNNKATVAPTYMNGASDLNTWGKVINDEASVWSDINSWKEFRPFHAGSLCNNTDFNDTKRITYSFSGKLLGNVTDSLRRRDARWNYYGNSYMAPMSANALLDIIESDHQPIEKTIWFWRLGEQGYTFYNSVLAQFGENLDLQNIPALSFFVLKNTSGVAGDLNIDYAHSVYDYALNPGAYTLAPARQSNNTTLRINIESENGAKDVVYLLEGDNFTDEYEGGADAEKLMGEGMNFYAADDTYNYSLLATDDVLGTLLSLQTKEDINYTLTFDKVRGEVYALRDNMTNAVVLMNEGATYSFTAQPNATLEGRFQIVSRQEMPTAVETVEETVNAPKAIYTVMGQYVGETTDWNILPAGVYVVDGVKIVK